jgi:hypothetical protein
MAARRLDSCRSHGAQGSVRGDVKPTGSMCITKGGFEGRRHKKISKV